MKSLWSRMQRVLGAEAHAAVDRAEDPQTMLAQLQRELVEAAGQARLAVARADAWRRQVAQRIERLEADVAKLGAAARSALERSDETMARAAIERRRAREQEVSGVRKQLEQANELVDRLGQRRERIARDLAALRDKRATLEQRSRFARSVRELDAPLGVPEPIAEVVTRMEDKVLREEAQADAALSIDDAMDEAQPRNELDDFIHDQSIDAELAELRAQINTDREYAA